MMKQENLNTWKYFQRIGLIVAVIASIGTVIGVYYQIETEEAKIELQLLSIDYLTANSNIDNLASNYKYEGVPVKNLWLVKFKLINSGDQTIIGVGDKKNIIGDKISFKYQNNQLQILDNIDIIKKEIPIDIVKNDSSTFSLYFDQWRKNESVLFSLYIKSDDVIKYFLPFVINRPIIDGDIEIIDYTINTNEQKIPIIDYLEEPLPLVIRVISIVVISAILILLTVLFSSFLIGYIRNSQWKRKYFDDFKEFVKIELLKEKNKELFGYDRQQEELKKITDEIINEPSRLPNILWKSFKGKALPVTYSEISSWKGFIGYLFLLVIEISVFSLIILAIVKK